jgi:ketosteroid isomerase-like protein
MPHRRLIALVLFFPLVGCATLHKGDTADPRAAAAKAVDMRFVQSFNAHDLDGMMSTYWKSDDLVVFPPDAMVVRGWSALREGYAAMLKQMPGARMEVNEAHYTPVDDNVLAWGLWTITMPDSTGHGTMVAMRGRFTEVVAKKDGKWVYVVDHPSVPLPPPTNAKH